MTQRNETKIRNKNTKRIAPDTRVPGSDGQIAGARCLRADDAPNPVTVTKPAATSPTPPGVNSWPDPSHQRALSVDIRCDVLPPYLRYRRVFANLSEVPPVALFR